MQEIHRTKEAEAHEQIKSITDANALLSQEVSKLTARIKEIGPIMAPPQPKLKNVGDFFALILNQYDELPSIKKLKNKIIPKLENRIGKKVNEHLNFNGELQGYGNLYFQYSEKFEEHGLKKEATYIGEWSEKNNKPHGRGILIVPSVQTTIGYWQNGNPADGNYVIIYSGGDFEVAEWYKHKTGKVKKRTTRYKVDGTSKQFGD